MSTGPVGTTLFENIVFSDPNDVEAVLLNYGAVRSGVLDQAIRNANAEQDARNQRINELNRVNAVLQRARPEFDTQGAATGTIFDDELPQILNVFPSFRDFVDDSNFPFTVREDGGFQQLLNAVRDEVDSASSNSQLELIALQALINRRNQTIEFTTNLVARFSGLQDRIVGNLRN